jgi:hypothetical protein
MTEITGFENISIERSIRSKSTCFLLPLRSGCSLVSTENLFNRFILQISSDFFACLSLNFEYFSSLRLFDLLFSVLNSLLISSLNISMGGGD